MKRSLVLALATTWALTAPAHSAEIHKYVPEETCDYRVKDSAGTTIEGVTVPDNGEYCIVAKRTVPKVPPKKLTFEDGFNETWGEQHGPQFLLPWSAEDIATVRRALDKTEEQHLTLGYFDEYLMGRRERIIEKLDTYSFIVLGTDGTVFRWVTNPEIILVGLVVSRDRYCRPEDQDVDELGFLEAGVECYVRNRAAIELFGRIEKAKHMMPGGRQ